MHLSDALKIVAFPNSVSSPKSHEIFKFRNSPSYYSTIRINKEQPQFILFGTMRGLFRD